MRTIFLIILALTLFACGGDISEVECTTSDECLLDGVCVGGRCNWPSPDTGDFDAGVDADDGGSNVDASSRDAADATSRDSSADSRFDDSGHDPLDDGDSGGAGTDAGVDSGTDTIPPSTPEGCLLRSINGSDMWECPLSMNWEDATSHCEAHGRSLASVDSAEEQRSLFEYIYDPNRTNTMIMWISVNEGEGAYQNWHPNIEPASECVSMSVITAIPNYPVLASCSENSDCTGRLCGTFGGENASCSCLAGLPESGGSFCLPYEYGRWEVADCNSLSEVFFCE